MMKKLASFFSKENSLRGASILLIITLATSNLLGLIRDRFLTKNIATYNLDVYYAAFRIPDLIFNFLILGAVSSAFIPIFSDLLLKNREKEGFKTTNNLINLALIAMAISAIILYFAMPWLIFLIVPKFDAERMALTVRYARILMITPIFFSASYIIGGMLNCYKRFLAFSLAPLVYNLSIIFGAILAPRFGVLGVIYCVVAGSFLHFIIQFVPAFLVGYRYEFYVSLADSSIKKIFRLMIPRTISMGSSQIMLIVYTAIGSALAAGSIAAYNLATNIQTMPVVVLGTSFATAVFPTLAAKISANEPKEFAFYLNRTLRAIGYLLIPSTAIFILLRAQIVRLILGSGKFSWSDTHITAVTLGLMSLSILAQGMIPLLCKAFYALKNTRTPMYISIVTVAISVILALPLAKYFSVAGLALAYSIGGYINLFLLIYYLQKRYKGIIDRTLGIAYAKTLAISLLMAFAVWGSLHLAAHFVNMTKFSGVLLQTTFASIIGLIIFILGSYLLHQEELKWALSRKINA